MQITVHLVSWLTFFILSSKITKDYSDKEEVIDTILDAVFNVLI